MYRLIVDVEATSNRMVYDFGACVMDDQGHIVHEYRALVREVWHGMPDEMATAYYAEKLPAYYIEQAAGTLPVLPLSVIRGDVIELLHDYSIKQVWAFNASYDRDALNLTTDNVSNGLLFNFMPDNVSWRCIHTLACVKVCDTKSYYRWALEHPDQMIKSGTGNLATNAQAVYQYLTKNPGFIEDHTALSDARIESAILWRVLSQKTKYKPYSKPSPGAWRIPQTGWKEYLTNLVN